jgi:Peptidase family M28
MTDDGPAPKGADGRPEICFEVTVGHRYLHVHPPIRLAPDRLDETSWERQGRMPLRPGAVHRKLEANPPEPETPMIPPRWRTRIVRFVALPISALLLSHGSLAGQDTPNPLGQPLLDASGEVRDDAFIHIPLRPDDQRYADIQGDHLKSLLMEVDAISLEDRDRGNVFWGRNVGTWGHVATEDWVEGYFRAHGLEDIHRESFDLAPVWVPHAWEIGFASGGEAFSLQSARPPEGMESTPADGLDFELAWLGTGSDADYLGRDVSGKAVLILDIPRPGTLRHSVATEGSIQRAFDHGAAAVGIVYGISDNFAVWQRTGGRPGFNVGYEDGLELRDRLGRGERVTVNLKMDSEEVPDRQAASVWGTLPGASDEEILIIAHMDGYFQASLDNASGLAVMVGLLEHFASVPREQRPRTIRFLGSVGHHSGPGTSQLASDPENRLANTVLAINLEHVAAVRTKYWGPRLRKMDAVSPMRWWVWGSEALLDLTLDSFNRFNVGVTGDMDDGASGEMSRMARLVPTIQVITSPEIKHTEQDTPSWVPAVGLEQIARAYARIIDGTNALTRTEIQPALAAAGGGE